MILIIDFRIQRWKISVSVDRGNGKLNHAISLQGSNERTFYAVMHTSCLKSLMRSFSLFMMRKEKTKIFNSIQAVLCTLYNINVPNDVLENINQDQIPNIWSIFFACSGSKSKYVKSRQMGHSKILVIINIRKTEIYIFSTFVMCLLLGSCWKECHNLSLHLVYFPIYKEQHRRLAQLINNSGHV